MRVDYKQTKSLSQVPLGWKSETIKQALRWYNGLLTNAILKDGKLSGAMGGILVARSLVASSVCLSSFSQEWGIETCNGIARFISFLLPFADPEWKIGLWTRDLIFLVQFLTCLFMGDFLLFQFLLSPLSYISSFVSIFDPFRVLSFPRAYVYSFLNSLRCFLRSGTPTTEIFLWEMS